MCFFVKVSMVPRTSKMMKEPKQRYIMDYSNCTILFTLPCLEDRGPLGELSFNFYFHLYQWLNKNNNIHCKEKNSLRF